MSNTAALPAVVPIPGSYGPWLIGPIIDRLNYFYNEGQDAFFAHRRDKYKSTVFRSNMPPGPFMAKNSKVIVLLDAASFPILFDTDQVDKRDVLTGTFIPPRSLTGGYRVLAYLDPSEPKHAQLKQLLFYLLVSRKDAIIPTFFNSFNTLFSTVEEEVPRAGKSDFAALNEPASFNYVTTSFFGVKPADTALANDGPKSCKIWLLFNLHPLFVLGLPKYLDDLLLHVFNLPPILAKPFYNKLYSYVAGVAGPILDKAVKMGIAKEEAIHNLVFATCFNAYGGFKIFLPALVKHIGLAGEKLHVQLAKEVRDAVAATARRQITPETIEKMPLVKSVVYEALRLDPPVQFQYGKAKKDLVISSHDASFQVKEGEVLFGYQPFATKDPKIFDKADTFVPDRFVGDGQSLLKYVLWANGRETDKPTEKNKMCAGRDFVLLGGRLLVVQLFLRYDTFTVDPAIETLAQTVINITSFKKAGTSVESVEYAF